MFVSSTQSQMIHKAVDNVLREVNRTNAMVSRINVSIHHESRRGTTITASATVRTFISSSESDVADDEIPTMK
jgi:hypothetical protein